MTQAMSKQVSETSLATHFREIRSSQGVLRVHPSFVTEISPSLVVNTLYSLPNAKASGTQVNTVTGRGATVRLTLASGRVLILREYRRGGFARFFSRRTFFWPPFTSTHLIRPFIELELIEELRLNGVHVPLPALAFVVCGCAGFCYRGAIATEQIEDAVNLLDLLARGENAEQMAAIAYLAGVQARAMLDCGVFHADFHLGNCLWTTQGQVYLLDFDKAFRFQDRRDRYEQMLISRWQRSVAKHTQGLTKAGRDGKAMQVVLNSELIRGLRG